MSTETHVSARTIHSSYGHPLNAKHSLESLFDLKAEEFSPTANANSALRTVYTVVLIVLLSASFAETARSKYISLTSTMTFK